MSRSGLLSIALAGIIFIFGCQNNSKTTTETTNKTGESVRTGKGNVLAVIGDRTITDSDLDRKIEEIPTYARQNFTTREGKLKLLDRLVRTELLKRAAIDAGYDKRPDIKAKLDDARERILTSEYFKNEMSEPSLPPEKDLKGYYEKNREQYKSEGTAKVRQIVVRGEDEARALHRKLVKGQEKFEGAVAAYSVDVESKENDGRMGTIRKGGFIRGIGKSRDFEDAIFKLKEGDLSTPIKTRKGWHIVKIDEIQPPGYQPFEDVKAKIVEEMMVTDEHIEKEYQTNQDQYVTRARSKIRHIQLPTEDAANEVYRQLKKGDDFDKLVETNSTDTASVKQKGSLGYLYKDGYIRGVGKDPEFEKAVFKLKENEFSKPIQTKKGWHIVLVEEKTDESPKPLSEVKAQIRNKLVRDFKEDGLEAKFDNLKEKYNCKIHEDRIFESK